MTTISPPPPTLIVLVRLQGFILTTAALPVLMPTEWMDFLHTQLQIGSFPGVPIVEYLTRSISVLYAVHGILLVFISFDLERYRPLLGVFILLHGIQGLVMLGIDCWAKMPWWWTLTEGPPITIFAILLGVLYWKWKSTTPNETSTLKEQA